MTTDPVLIAYTAKRAKSGHIILLELDERDHERLAAERARHSAKPQIKASAPDSCRDSSKSDEK